MVKLALDQSNLVMSQKKAWNQFSKKNLSGNGPYLCSKKHVCFAQIESKVYSLRKKKNIMLLGKNTYSGKKIDGKKHSERILVWNVNRFSSKSYSLKKYIFFVGKETIFFFK